MFGASVSNEIRAVGCDLRLRFCAKNQTDTQKRHRKKVGYLYNGSCV